MPGSGGVGRTTPSPPAGAGGSSSAPAQTPWTSADAPSAPQQGDPSGGAPTAPAIPGKTSVDTPSLDLFAANLNELITPLKQAYSDLEDVDVQPGAFYHADQIRNQINGVDGTSGLKSQYQQVLTDLVTGLTDTVAAVQKMSRKYSSVEDLNKASAADVQSDLTTASGDFSQMMSDAASGGASSSGGSGGG
jgi:hypothetical protein